MSVRTKIVTVTDMGISPKVIADAGIVDEHNATLLKFILPMDYIDNDYLYFLDIVNGSGGESPTAHIPAVLEEVNGDTVTTVSFELPDYITRLGVANVTLNVEELNSGDNTIVDLLVRTIPISLKFTGQKKTNGTIILELTDMFNSLLVRIEVAISASGVATANAIIATENAVTATGRANDAAAIVENSLLIVDTVDDLDPDAEDGTKATVRSVEQYVNNHIPILVNTYYDKLYINPTPEYIIESDIFPPTITAHAIEIDFNNTEHSHALIIYFAGATDIPDTLIYLVLDGQSVYVYCFNANMYYGTYLTNGWYSIDFNDGVTATPVNYTDIPIFENFSTMWSSMDPEDFYFYSKIFGNYLSSTPYYVTAEYVPYIFDTEWKRVYNNITGVYGMDGTISTVETYADLAPTAPDDTIIFVEKDTLVEQSIMTIVPDYNYTALYLKPIIDIANLPYTSNETFAMLQTDFSGDVQPVTFGAIEMAATTTGVPAIVLSNFNGVQVGYTAPDVNLFFETFLFHVNVDYADYNAPINMRVFSFKKYTWSFLKMSTIRVSTITGTVDTNYDVSNSDGMDLLGFSGIKFSNTGDYEGYILPHELFSETPWEINYSGFYKMIDGTWTLIKKGDWNPKIIVQEEPA